MAWKRVLSVVLVAGMLLALQVTMARAERRVTGQVVFEDAAGATVHASFNVTGDDGTGSGRVAVDVRELGISWEGVVDCIDFPPTGAGWANFAGTVTGSQGVDAALAYFHVEVVGQGQGQLPADYVRVRLLEGPYQGDRVVSQDPFVTELLVGEPGDPPSCMYGADLAWGALTDHRPVQSGNLQVHGAVGGNRQHGPGGDDGDTEPPPPSPGEPDPPGDGATDDPPVDSPVRDRRATGGFVFDDGGLVHVSYNIVGEDGQGSGRIRVRSADGSLTWSGAVDCVDFVPEGGGWAYFTGHLTSAEGVTQTHFSAEVIGSGQGSNADPDFVRLELLDGPERDDDGSCLLYWEDITTGSVRLPEFHEIVKGNLQVHGPPSSSRQHLDDAPAGADADAVVEGDLGDEGAEEDAGAATTADAGPGKGEGPPDDLPPSTGGEGATPPDPGVGGDEPDDAPPPGQAEGDPPGAGDPGAAGDDGTAGEPEPPGNRKGVGNGNGGDNDRGNGKNGG